MEIPDSLVTSVVYNALVAPYRQTRPMQEREFVRWLNDRDVSINSESLLLLAREGVFPPIAWEAPPESASTDRFIPVEVDGLGLVYGDRGQTPDFKQLLDRAQTKNDHGHSWWHPFQLWRATWVTRFLQIGIASFQGLYGPDRYRQLVDKLFQLSDPRERLVSLTTQERWSESFAVIGMLLAAEPLVIEALTGRISTDALSGETVEGMFAWRQEIDHDCVLRENHCSTEMMRRWHAKLAIDAELDDPLSRWRELIAYVPRRKRLTLKGAALRAEDGYYQAEVLRRYLAIYHGVTDLPDEDLVRLGPQVPSYKERFFGRQTTTDGDRSVFRNVVRQYDLDPQPRVRWFVEGETEIGFIERWAELRRVSLERAGIELLNLKGVGKLEDPLVRAFLILSQQEEIFVAMTVDGDDKGAERRRVLEKMSESGLLPAGYAISEPNFEDHNFSIEVMLSAAGALNTDVEPVQSSDLETSPSGKGAGFETLRKAYWKLRTVELPKGIRWGRALADALNGTPTADESPIHDQFTHLLRGSRSNYRFSTKSVQ